MEKGDDFLALTQCTNKEELKRLTICMLYAITNAFPTSEETGSMMGPLISPKKLEEE